MLLSKSEFVKKLNGTYVDYQKVFSNIYFTLYLPAKHSGMTPILEKYFVFLDSDTDIHWKIVCFKLLALAGKDHFVWPPLTDDTEELKIIRAEFSAWFEEELAREKKFLPNWYVNKIRLWELGV